MTLMFRWSFMVFELKLSMYLKSKLKKIYTLYADGFRSMTVGRSLWIMIIIKVFILFAILKVFFFPDFLSSNYDNDSERAEAVRSTLTNKR